MTDKNRPGFFASLNRAWKTYWGHFGQMLLFMAVELVLRLIVLAPLLFLFVKGYELWALAAIPLFVLVVIPARRSAAFACRSLLHGGDLFSPELALNPAGYGRSLLSGLATGVRLLIWAVPLAAVCVYLGLRYLTDGVQGHNDIITLAQQLAGLGGGDPFRGVLIFAAGLFGLALLPTFACAYYSGERHKWIRTGSERRWDKGGRGGILAAWLLGIGLFLPFAAAIALIGRDYVASLLGSLQGAIRQAATETATEVHGQEVPVTVAVSLGSGHIWAAAGAFLVLALPLFPLRMLFTACRVDDLWESGT